MNKEEKKNGTRRFNLLDVTLILIALLCVVGVWQRSNLQEFFASDEATESYTVTFEIKKLRSSTAELLQKDTALYLKDGEDIISLGTLTQAVSSTAATAYFENGRGEMVDAVYPENQYENLQDIKGTLSCRGIRRDGAFLLGGKIYLAVNQTVEAYTENADFTICITSITKNN